MRLALIAIALLLLAARAHAAGPQLDLDTATATPGTVAAVTITLTRNGASNIGSTSNDVGFDSTALSITPATDCTLSTTLLPKPPWMLLSGKVCHNGTHACSVDGNCTGSGVPPCDVLRVGVVASPTTAISGDGVTVTCGFTVAPATYSPSVATRVSAPSGTYPLSNKPSAYDLHGNPIRGVTGAAGAVIVP